MKNPLTPAGIEPATFQFVAQHLNQCATAVPVTLYDTLQKEKSVSEPNSEEFMMAGLVLIVVAIL